MLNITMEVYTIEKYISNGRKMEIILCIWSKFKHTFEVRKKRSYQSKGQETDFLARGAKKMVPLHILNLTQKQDLVTEERNFKDE